MGDAPPTWQRVEMIEGKPTVVKKQAPSMLQQAQADWEELRSKPPQEPQVGPAQEAALGELEEELKTRALEELDEQAMQEDCERTAAEESAGIVADQGGGSANNAESTSEEERRREHPEITERIEASIEAARLAAEIMRQDEEQQVEDQAADEDQAVTQRSLRGLADRTRLAQITASRQREQAETWPPGMWWGAFPPTWTRRKHRRRK